MKLLLTQPGLDLEVTDEDGYTVEDSAREGSEIQRILRETKEGREFKVNSTFH